MAVNGRIIPAPCWVYVLDMAFLLNECRLLYGLAFPDFRIFSPKKLRQVGDKALYQEETHPSLGIPLLLMFLFWAGKLEIGTCGLLRIYCSSVLSMRWYDGVAHLTIALLRSLQSRLCWQWCAAQSYDACVFHLLLMLMLQFVTDEIWMGAFGKFVFIGTVSTIASFIFTWLLRIIPCVKRVLWLSWGQVQHDSDCSLLL